MDGSGLTTGDLALMKDNNNMFDGAGGMAFWIFALLFLNNGAFGGGRPMGPAPVTSAELDHASNLYKLFMDYYKILSDKYSEMPAYIDEIKSDIIDMYSEQSMLIKNMHEMYKK